MAREFKGKLTAEDIAYLRARRPLSQVNQMIELHGTTKGADSDESAAKAAAEAQEAAEKAALEAEEAAREAEAKAAAAAAEESTENDADHGALTDPEEDLIGDTGGAYDVLAHTEAEIKEWAAGASDEAKAAALQAESSREDREPRKGVVSLLS